MADLNDRGQMLLVGGLAVAVSIVVLIVLLNSAIYTQNVATRGSGAQADEPLEYRAAMEDATAALLDAENERNYTERAALWANATEAIHNVSAGLREQWVGSVAAAALDSRTLHNGTYVVQNDTRSLTGDTGGTNWTVVTGAEAVRSFELNLTRVEGETLDLDPVNGSTRINVSGGGSTWQLYAFNDSVNGPTIAVKNGSESTPSAACTFDFGDRIDLTEGTVGGTDCPELSFAKGTTAPWNVSVTYGNKTNGTYSLTANTTQTGALHGPGSADSPRWEPRIYSADLELSYRTPDLLYEVAVGVAPGEDDE